MLFRSNIDHQYKHCDNLGGWAVEISTTYQNWKEGKEVVSPEMEEHFNELKALGFNFDINECYEVTRTWDDHYEMLVQYKEKNGNARVPLKWKADLRLGKWVQLQRKAKRTNKLSEEHRKFVLHSLLLFLLLSEGTNLFPCYSITSLLLQVKSWSVLDSNGKFLWGSSNLM